MALLRTQAGTYMLQLEERTGSRYRDQIEMRNQTLNRNVSIPIYKGFSNDIFAEDN